MAFSSVARWAGLHSIAAALSLALAGAALAQSTAQPFDAPVMIGPVSSVFRAVADLDGDGDLDALRFGIVGTTFQISGWANDGHGGFTPAWSVAPSLPAGYTNFASRIAVGDLDGDGDDDFVASALGALGWWLSNGLAAPATPAFGHFAPGEIKDVATVDADGDGDDDVVVLSGNRIEVLLAQGTAPPLLAASFTVSGSPLPRLVVGEYDGSPGADLVIASGTLVSVFPLPAAAVGSIAPSITLLLGVPVTDLGGGDVDGDGDLDLLAGTSFSNGPGLHLVRRTGPASYVDVPIGTAASDLRPCHVLADLDGDGDLDGIGAVQNAGLGSVTTVPTNTRVAYMLNDGTGVFSATLSLEASGVVFEPIPGDFDGDGRTDLILGRNLQLARGPHGVVPDPASIVSRPEGESIFVDVDRDGDVDAGYALSKPISFTSPPAAVRTLLNGGDGRFTPSTQSLPPAPGNLRFMGSGIPGDFDGDGDLDIIVEDVSVTMPGQVGSAIIPNGTRLLRNVGGGDLVDGALIGANMAAPFQYLLGGNPTIALSGYPSTEVAMARDVDGDGDVDVVTRRPTSSQVWLNGGAANFSAGGAFAGFHAAGVAELTGDGIPDLVGTTWTAAESSICVILPGTGAGAFVAPSAPGALTIDAFAGLPNTIYLGFANTPAIVDLDQDGDLDLVFAAPGGPHLLTNLGGGAFSLVALASPAPSAAMGRVLVEDFDLDGTLDMVTDGADSRTGFWWKGLAAGSFAPPLPIGVIPAAAGDVDGDGDLDLVTRASVNGTYAARVVRNLARQPAGFGSQLQYGTGLAGAGGWIPVLGSQGVLRAGFTGEIRISNALGGATAVMAFGDAAASLPFLGGTNLTNQQFFLVFPLGGPAGIAGAGHVAIPWTLPASFAGLTFYEQAGIIDPAAAQGVALTQGLRITIGQ